MRRKSKRAVGKDLGNEIIQGDYYEMKKYFNDFKDNKELICVYSNETDTESFAAGYVVGVSKDDIILYHLTPRGTYDGYLLLPIDNIFLTEYNTRYTKKLYNLSQIQFHENMSYFKNESLKSCLLKYAHENDFVVEVQLVNSGLNDVVGKVFSFDEEKVIVDKYTEYGEQDGQAVFNILDITRLSCDNEEERTIKHMIQL